jgi:hypothetical protein
MGRTMQKQKGKSLIPKRGEPLVLTPVQTGQKVFVEASGRLRMAYCSAVGNGETVLLYRIAEDTIIAELIARTDGVRLDDGKIILGENTARTYQRGDTRYNFLDQQLRSARL